MEQQKAVKPAALETLLTSLKSDFRHLMASVNGSWNTPDDREQARLALAKSVREANRAVQELEGVPDAELRRLHDALLIQSTLSEDAVKNPNSLKR